MYMYKPVLRALASNETFQYSHSVGEPSCTVASFPGLSSQGYSMKSGRMSGKISLEMRLLVALRPNVTHSLVSAIGLAK